MNSLRRLVDKLFGRSAIEAGGSGRRWGGFGLRRPASEIHKRSEITAARAGDSFLNSPYGNAIVEAWVSNLVGDGPSIRPDTLDLDLRKRLVVLWGRFWNVCDADGLLAMDGFLEALARSLVVTGEAFVHLIVDRDTGGLQLRLWASSQVDRTMNRDLGNGARIVAGVEFSRDGKRDAYHVRENPDLPFATNWSTKRVPAEDVLHLFKVLFPGQVRGISWLTPSLTRDAEITKLEDALLAKFNVSALVGLIFKRPDGGNASILPIDENGEYSMSPGATIIAPPGYEVEGFNGGSAEGATDFLRSQIRSAAAGAGVPYELVSGDLSQVNYSSARMGLMEFRRRAGALQKSLIVARFLRPVWRRLLLIEALNGRMLPSVATSMEAEFIFTGWAQIDPKKETEADIAAIKARTKSRFEVIASRGRDPEEVDAEIAADRKSPNREAFNA